MTRGSGGQGWTHSSYIRWWLRTACLRCGRGCMTVPHTACAQRARGNACVWVTGLPIAISLLCSSLRKHRRVRERSRSSSSSSQSSRSYKAEDYPEEPEEREEAAPGFDKSRLGTKDFAGPNERGRARGAFVSGRRGGGGPARHPSPTCAIVITPVWTCIKSRRGVGRLCYIPVLFSPSLRHFSGDWLAHLSFIYAERFLAKLRNVGRLFHSRLHQFSHLLDVSSHLVNSE